LLAIAILYKFKLPTYIQVLLVIAWRGYRQTGLNEKMVSSRQRKWVNAGVRLRERCEWDGGDCGDLKHQVTSLGMNWLLVFL